MRCKAWVLVTTVNRKGTKAPMTRIRPVGDAYARLVDDPPMPSRLVTPSRGKGKAFTTASANIDEISSWLKTKRRVPQVFTPTAPEPGAELCGGTIEALVAAEDEPYMGGSSAVLSISYKCSRCGHTYHGTTLPSDSDTLSAWLTAQIAALDDPEREIAEAAAALVTGSNALTADADASVEAAEATLPGAPLASQTAPIIEAVASSAESGVVVSPAGDLEGEAGEADDADWDEGDDDDEEDDEDDVVESLDPATPVVALIAFTDHRDHAVVYVFAEPEEVAATTQALIDLTRVAPDGDGWLTFGRAPFVGTYGVLLEKVSDLGIPGFANGLRCVNATAPQILAVARALAQVSAAQGESVMETVREFISSGFRVEGLSAPWADAVEAAVPGFAVRTTRLFDIPEMA